MPKKTGRPCGYTKEIGEKVCQLLTEGFSTRQIERMEGLPSESAIYRWLLREDCGEFREQYARARRAQAERMAVDILDIADNGTNDFYERETKAGNTITTPDTEAIQRSRLRVDTRKWLLSKLLPKKYGDKMDVTSGGEKLAPSLTVIVRPEKDEGDG